jgi:hypothetical protein
VSKIESGKLELNPISSLAKPTGGNRIMSTIDKIVRELENIPEPMQLSVLEFVRSLHVPSSANDPKLPPRILGLNRGAMKIRADFDEPLPDEFWLGEE